MRKSYFVYEVGGWYPLKKRIWLSGNNIEHLMSCLENGGNLFEVVYDLKNLSGDDISGLNYCLFEHMDGLHVGDKEYISKSGFTKIGKLMVPYNKIMSRDLMSSLSEDVGISTFDRKVYKRVLSDFCDSNEFYRTNDYFFAPLIRSDVLVLNKHQIL